MAILDIIGDMAKQRIDAKLGEVPITATGKPFKNPYTGLGRAASVAAAVGGGMALGPFGLLLGLLPLAQARLAGITAGRLHESELEKAAQDRSAFAEADSQITDLIAGARENATDTDQRQLDVLASQQETLRKLTGHPDARVRAQALAQMMQLQAGVGGYYEDLESRQEALADRAYSERKEYAAAVQKDLSTTRARIRDIDTQADTAYRLIDEAPQSEATQGFVRRILETSAAGYSREGGFSVGLGPLGFNTGGDLKPLTRDEMIKVVSAWQAGQKNQLQQFVTARLDAAQKDGFRPQIEDGKVTLEDLNVLPKGSEPRKPRPQPAGTERAPPSDKLPVIGSVNKALRNLDEYMTGRAELPQEPAEDPNAARIRQKYQARRRITN